MGLWPLRGVLHHAAIQPLLHSLSKEPGRLATLWVCLSLWPAQTQPPGPTPHQWPPNSPAPVHLLLCSLFIAFLELDDARDLCCTGILTVAAVASGAQGAVAAS